MKRIGIGLVLLVAGISSAGGAEVALSVGLDWMAGARLGAEYLFLPKFGVQGHAGMSIPGAVTSDLFMVAKILQPSDRFSLRLLAGVPNAMFPLGASASMISLGASVEARWRLSRRFALSLRAGEGYPFFFEKSQYVGNKLNFLLGLWPDLVLSLWFLL